MASQRVTIVKLGGVSAEVALQRVNAWFAARDASDPNQWSPEQWPDEVRQEADEFADRLRTHGLKLPIIHFVEWADLWSIGYVFPEWLTPPDRPNHVGFMQIDLRSLPMPCRMAVNWQSF